MVLQHLKNLCVSSNNILDNDLIYKVVPNLIFVEKNVSLTN